MSNRVFVFFMLAYFQACYVLTCYTKVTLISIKASGKRYVLLLITKNNEQQGIHLLYVNEGDIGYYIHTLKTIRWVIITLYQKQKTTTIQITMLMMTKGILGPNSIFYIRKHKQLQHNLNVNII